MKFFLSLILLISISCQQDKASNRLPLQESPRSPVEVSEDNQWINQFVELVNIHRRSIGRRPLIHHSELAKIVSLHSENMAAKTTEFGHEGFSERCRHSRSALGGGNWCGENVAHGQSSPEEVFNAWMNSSAHRANIEQSRATHTGLAFAKSETGIFYWTQIFVEL